MPGWPPKPGREGLPADFSGALFGVRLSEDGSLGEAG
jgi:hypothetical protein